MTQCTVFSPLPLASSLSIEVTYGSRRSRYSRRPPIRTELLARWRIRTLSRWRAPSIFEDSPICPNFSDASRPQPCQSCLLAEFVPEALRKEKAACRFIELTKEGQTLEDLYRTGSQVEIEEALANWLRAQIERIEQERAASGERGVA